MYMKYKTIFLPCVAVVSGWVGSNSSSPSSSLAGSCCEASWASPSSLLLSAENKKLKLQQKWFAYFMMCHADLCMLACIAKLNIDLFIDHIKVHKCRHRNTWRRWRRHDLLVPALSHRRGRGRGRVPFPITASTIY